MEKQTRKEALIELFNANQKQAVLDEINIQFFHEKAKNFKKGTPENVGAINQAKEREASLFYYKILLKVISSMIEKEVTK